MNLFTIDFETYYSKEYSLSKMSTEDYVHDPRFEIIMVSVKKNAEPVTYFSGTFIDTFKWMYAQGCFHGAWLCHNAMFDCLIAAVKFKFVPKMIFDTRLMAQAVIRPYTRSVSLANCLKHIDLGIQKGDEVHNMLGRTRTSLNKVELQKYATYCMTDSEATYRLFKFLAPQFPKTEFEIMDSTLRMYLQPKLELDAAMLAEILQEVRAKKAQQLMMLPPEVTAKVLASNQQFAELLEQYGIDPPTKISPTTNAITFAFAKGDPGFKELEEEYEDDPMISAILAARIGVKSTLEEARTERLLNIAIKYPHVRVPLLYYAAHTGREGGMEKINMQNPPRIDRSRLRFAIKAPKDHVVLGLDLAQIEARVTAWLAGQHDLLDDFRNKIDIYSKFATRAFKTDTVKGRSKEDDKRRFVGKTCILGLGFGMGAAKLKGTLRKDNIKADVLESERYVWTYRETYPRIPVLWRSFDAKLRNMASNRGTFRVGPVTLTGNIIVLPNGMNIVYHDLRHVSAGSNKKMYEGWVYQFGGELRTLWGGKVTENVVQALARILVMGYMLDIKRALGLLPSLRVHDELDYIVHVREVEHVAKVCTEIMHVPPSWAPDLPVAVEANWGPTFGDCK